MRKKKTMDGNAAAAHVAYAFTEIAPIYPITPSSAMAELVDEWSAAGRENLWGKQVKVVEMQSEAGVAGVLHGSLVGGKLASTFSSSQGLLLMIPNMFKIAGELLPSVIYVAARAIATHALSIFGDHSDVYACRSTGFAMLCCGSVQEVMDLSPIAHLAAVSGRVPFLNFFDGFRTSHELQKIEVWEYEQLQKMLIYEDLDNFRGRAMTPENPTLRGVSQNPDVFFQNREASNPYYNALPEIVEEYMAVVNQELGQNYRLFNYYGHKEAERVIVAMGSVCDTIEEVIDCLNSKGERLGLVKVRLFRPFSVSHFIEAIPESVRGITVLDRAKEPGAVFEALHLDVVAALSGSKSRDVEVFGGRYGLGSKDTTPQQIAAVFKNMKMKAVGKRQFTIGIDDDVTDMSLEDVEIELTDENINCKFWGVGSDGTIGAAQNSIKIIGDATDMQVQGYFHHDSKKSLGLTISHLRFGNKPIKSRYLVKKADFVACHHTSYITDAFKDVVEDIKEGGIFLFNTSWSQEELESKLPARVKRCLALRKIKFYVIAANKIASELGLGNKISTILQAAFFKLIGILPEEKAMELMKQAATESFLRKGKEVVELNHRAIERGICEIKEIKIPEDWVRASDEESFPEHSDYYSGEFLDSINAQKGDNLPVDSFLEFADGVFPVGYSKFEKMSLASNVPCWNPQNCIQCNFCSYVCPHAAIRPVVLSQKEADEAPDEMKLTQMNGLDCRFGVTISISDCLGCEVCVEACPGKMGQKALEMKPLTTQLEQQKPFDYGLTLSEKPEVFEKFASCSVKGSQFKQPLLEFSGACAGCGETPYVKLLTQLFGDRLSIACATGCSSIWGASFPFIPFTKNKRGQGPAWGNSLFEDNAEYGYGIYLAQTLNGESGSVWLVGGDGWAYDIGFGGLDHVMATGENINALVLDTEAYSNTGGQSSKATQIGAFAKFAAGGKSSLKKDLAAIMMSYGHVYVAQIALGADFNQTINAITEAKNYEGPSIVIAYAPCISHGIKAGMQVAQLEAKRAVQSGYWHLFRYDPRRKLKGENPFQLDSKKPTRSIEDFWLGETRYSHLKNTAPEKWSKLLNLAQTAADEKYERLKKLAES
ncbi:pyruvate-flavodoxin oxidoreductase [Clostridia bacterium]|nr:pyruvate-flavodoxin oxidoreductase [Clostridia bacterium]